MRECEKIAREIEKTSESIRKKHRALKTGREEASETFERSATLSKSDQWHDVQPITACYDDDRITDRVVRERFRNDGRFVSDESSNCNTR
ncbi:hypothetical protein ALC60_11177 [Trachymyrmex zeteki]|uniref:Uncharacterized protein n=1 Tax=Mycetomoellerius zeteki TaxID=64791 RepID=A0A151WPJ6_9HYME|nr:hypothetical protein ALC60_11177 [Trachymyrmex zeteki]